MPTATKLVTRSFFGKVESGKVMLEQPWLFTQWLQQAEDFEIEVRLGPRHQDRTLQQNRYYFGVIIPALAKHLGYGRDEHDELHEALKARFLRAHEDSPLPTVRSTRNLTIEEFGEYMDRVIQLSAELGCVVPLPNEGS